jgi:hypothetical protein
MERAKFSRILLLIFSIALSTAPALAQRPVEHNGIGLKTSISRDRVKGGDTLTYSIELTWPGEEDKFLIEEIRFGFIKNLILAGSKSEISFYQADDLKHTRKRYLYTLVADTLGPAVIDSFAINYYDTQADSFMTKSYQVEIRSPRKPVSQRFAWFLLAVGLLLALGYVFRIYRRIKRPPGESYISKTLDKLFSLDSQMENFAPELKSIVVKYLELKLNQRLTGRTTAEIVGNLNSITAERKQLIKDILEECDRLAFTPGLVDPILADNLKDQVRRFLEQEKSWTVE